MAASFVLTLVTEAVQCEVVSAHIQTHTYRSRHAVVKKIKRNHCHFSCSVAGTEQRHWCWFFQPTTEQFACLVLSGDIAKHCCLTAGHTKLHLGDERPPLGYLLSLHRGGVSMKMTSSITKGAESEQPVGAPVCRRVGCRDHAAVVCFLHSGIWQAQGGPAFMCRDQRKCVFHNMGPLTSAC